MPITVKNSAGGGVTLDSSTSSNETINLNTPVFTGNVAVGSPLLTTTASNMLQIGSTSNLSWYNQGDDELDINVNAVNNSGNKYIEAKAASQYIQHAGIHYFNVAASGSAGAAITWNTGLEVLATGKARAKNGLLFGTDTAAANTLDDYEEGTWTPAILGGSMTIGAIESARYTKIGNVVVLQGYLTLNNNGDGNSVEISGMPFVNGGTGANANQYSMGGISHGGGSNLTEMKYCRTQSNTSYLSIYKKASTGVIQTEVDGDYFLFSVTYRTTA